MMSRIKLLVLSCIAAIAVGAVVSPSAFAAFEETAVECKNEGLPGICLAKTEAGPLLEARGTEEIAGTKLKAGTTAVLTSSGIGLVIKCKKANATGELEQAEPLVKAGLLMKTVISFSECAVTGAHEAECKVVEPIKTKPLDGELKSATEVLFTPESGRIFTEIEIGNKTGTCPATIKGINPVKGEQTCNLPEKTKDERLQALNCTTTGSKLEFGTNAATFAAEAEFGLKSESFFDFTKL
jgi:hypothetical protein